VRLLLIGLILTCLTLLTACDSRQTWDTWQITCTDLNGHTSVRRFEGRVSTYDGPSLNLYSRHGGKEYIMNQQCSYKWLGEAGELHG